MLIEIDGSAIADALASGGTSTRSRECIENLLLAHHTAKHVVMIPPERLGVLDGIARDFSNRARGALRSIRAQWAEIRGLRGRMRWIMRLGVGPTFQGEAVDEAGKQVILAPLHAFHDPERVGRSVLLGENLTDAALYRTMATAYIALLGWRTQIVAFARLGGGGSSTTAAFMELIAEGRIVIAVADSDRRHPAGDLGGTAAKLTPVARLAFQHVHVLHVRFAENLISSSIYTEAFAGKHRKLASVARLMQAEALPSAVPWRDHAELKHGIKLFRVQALPPGSPEATFWSQAATDVQREQCQQVGLPPCGTEQNCQCYVADGFGPDALELAVAWLAPRDPRRNARLLGIERRTPVGDLCEKLLAWGIAPAERPA
jgi:hypothetical protein